MLVKRATDPIVTKASQIGVAVVADREVTRGALLGLVSGDPELYYAGSASDPQAGEALLASSDVNVMLVSLSLGQPAEAPPAVSFIRKIKAQRPDVGVLSLKRDVDEPHLRAALNAGADACCMATTSGVRLLQAIKAVAAGATWLDPEISRILLHPVRTKTAAVLPRLTPREGEILRLLTDGYTNEEIAERLLCAPSTVKTHLLHLFRKLGVNDRVSAAVSALRNGLL